MSRFKYASREKRMTDKDSPERISIPRLGYKNLRTPRRRISNMARAALGRSDFHLEWDDGLHLRYVRNFFDPGLPFEDLLQTLEPLESTSHRFWMKARRPKEMVVVPRRKVCAFADVVGSRYRYSRTCVEAKRTWPPFLADAKAAAERLLNAGGAASSESSSPLSPVRFNFALVNYYPDGRASLGRHRDDEESMARDPWGRLRPIACLTYGRGEPRTLVFREWKNPRNKVKLRPENGSLYVMEHPTNKKWTHEIRPEPGVKDPRISITFRMMNFEKEK